MSAPAPTTPAGLNGIATPLPHLGVMRAKGDDAASFLQGQLTQDVVLMKPGEARLAAFCNAKGRMLASFQVLKVAADELLLVTSADTLAATLKRLSMFVLRAKAKLSDATADVALAGLLGDAAVSIAARARRACSARRFPLQENPASPRSACAAGSGRRPAHGSAARTRPPASGWPSARRFRCWRRSSPSLPRPAPGRACR